MLMNLLNTDALHRDIQKFMFKEDHSSYRIFTERFFQLTEDYYFIERVNYIYLQLLCEKILTLCMK